MPRPSQERAVSFGGLSRRCPRAGPPSCSQLSSSRSKAYGIPIQSQALDGLSEDREGIRQAGEEEPRPGMRVEDLSMEEPGGVPKGSPDLPMS